jgi:hypothetical protein
LSQRKNFFAAANYAHQLPRLKAVQDDRPIPWDQHILNPRRDRSGHEGSAFKINLGALSVGDVISFDYDFLTSDLTRSDFAFWELNGGAIHVFADTSSPFLQPTTGAGNPFSLETTYHTVSITITSAGRHLHPWHRSDGCD